MSSPAWQDSLSTPEPSLGNERTIKVLLIDDDEDYYLIIQELLSSLESNRYELVWAPEYSNAIEQLQTTQFDAILVDYHLGTHNGVEITREITNSGMKTPVIVLTGHGSYKLDLEAMQAGAVDYLVKNDLNASLLERTLRYAMERKGTESELERRVQERTHELALAVDGLRAEIAERLRAEKKIAYQANLLANVSDAIIATDAHLLLTSWNRAAEQLYGWTASEVLGKPLDEILRSEYIGISAEAAIRRLLDTGEFNAVVIQYHKDNHPIYIEGKTMALRDDTGQVTGFVSVNRNITERSQNEEANRQMAAELNSVHLRLIENVEAERLFLSQELHDGPIQVLHGMVFKIAPTLTSTTDPEVHELLSELRQMALDLIGSLRSISNDLRPPALAPFGLEKAIRSHAEKFAADHPEIQVTIDLDSDGQRLPERVRLAMFRIYQQALVNILKHAQATQVGVEFRVDLHNAVLRVLDNGVGFEAPSRLISLARDGHLGLVGAAERAAAVGGQLKVDSQPGQGTTIQVEIPY